MTRALITASLPWNSPYAFTPVQPLPSKVAWTLVHDPTPVMEGGYRPGAQFSREEVKCTLKLGYFCPGTRFVNSLGEVWEVTPKSKGVGLYLKQITTPE